MPYKTNKDLPKSIRDNLPQGAQTIYRKVYNNAHEQYKDRSNQTEISSRVAWSAVKKKYKKKQDKWVKI